ncbi:MAG: bifunctional serine/threonine-protein kinase/formylglycine-generating enzyme family protein [Cyanobacteria bacterium J06629_19]
MSQPKLLDSRYRVTQKLSEGGFGVTYLAQDTRRPGEPLCVAKELRHEHQNNPKIIQLFHQEAEMLERLGCHDQIPQLLASFYEANRLYLVQEYIDGITVYDELLSPSGKRLKTEAEVVALLRDVLLALAFVHRHQVVHRDIKPANLMRRKRDGKIMLIDFGAVKALTHSQIQANGQLTTTVSIGSPGYSPHEQIFQGNPRPASDIYALGITAIEALTGVHPTELWTDPNTAELVWTDSAHFSPSLTAFLTQMVRHHFSRRFQDANAALKALEIISPAAAPSVDPTKPPIQLLDPSPSEPSPSLALTKVVGNGVGDAPLNRSRRDLLRFLGFSAAGMVITLGGQQLLRGGNGRDGNGRGENGLSAEGSVASDSADNSLPTETGGDAVPVKGDEVPPLERERETSTEPTEPSSVRRSIKTTGFQTIKVDNRGQIVDTLSESARYFDEPYFFGRIEYGLPLQMVEIPAGEFMMGSPDTETDRDKAEGPQKQITIPSFFIGAFAITQQQYQVVVGSNPSRFSQDGANRPVERVSWDDAVSFCERLSQQTGANYRLPSAAEWEYACRAGATTPFAFGDTLTTDIANYSGDFAYKQGPLGANRKTTVNVDNFYPNSFGLYNTHGNVQEWCMDDLFEGREYTPHPSDPVEPGMLKAVRGGSWFGRPDLCRSAAQHHDAHSARHDFTGFRVVCEPV